MKNLIYLLVVIAAATACNLPKQRPHLTDAQKAARMDSLKTDLLKTDLAFSQLSEEKGRNAAFSAYADSGATMLRGFSQPVTGKDTIINVLNNHPDTGFVLTWVPIRADIARSGDLGYTYGTYILQFKDVDKTGGTYCTVWKKDKNNQWKFVLSTGNEGVDAQ
jgi:hypothetical protein